MCGAVSRAGGDVDVGFSEVSFELCGWSASGILFGGGRNFLTYQ